MKIVNMGGVVPLKSGEIRGTEFLGDYLKMSGLVVTAVHPERIAVSGSGIDFTYTISGKEIVRGYVLERSDGKISAFITPDGTRTEVIRNG